MSALPGRISGAIARLGDACEIDSAESTGLFRVLSADEAASYLSEAELDAAARPIRLVHLAHDDPASVADEIVWNGLTLTVLKIIDLRVAYETVSRLAIAA